jgi:tRNA (cytidine/uridine-2'-O-)-methyltransferase
LFNIVLLEPEIPANTGNIGRTCLATGSHLHLIEPMGFILNDKKLKRAGMDYWHELDITVYDSLADFFDKNKDALSKGARLWMATTKAQRVYSDACFRDGDFIMFGKESAGIPEDLLLENREFCIRIPMAENQRSLNLSNSAAVILYEALRQNDYLSLIAEGRFRNHSRREIT